MKGLRGQENDKFNKFFDQIQKAASRFDSVFFADAGEGDALETDTIECETMMGWLIPNDKEEEFSNLWKQNAVDDSWSDYFTWANWELKGTEVTINFS